MSLIDLVIPAFTETLAASNTAQYARIDNTSTPVFTTVPGITALPFDLTPDGVPDGQYQVTLMPNYPNGASCPAFTYTTPPCPQMTAVSAVQTGNNIVVNYTAPTTGPAGQSIANVSLTITGPNGSVYNVTVTNGTNGGQIVYPIPTGVYGNYTVSMQTVCDATSGFFGAFSPPVTVSVAAPVTAPTLSGTMTVICGTGSCNGQQAAGLQFNLTAPLSADLTIQMAYQLHTPTGEQQFGTSIIPPSLITGTAVATGYASFIIPAGVLQANISNGAISFGGTVGGGFNQTLICFCGSDPDVSTIFIDKLFLHPANQPTIQINLTAIDTRITITQI